MPADVPGQHRARGAQTDHIKERIKRQSRSRAISARAVRPTWLSRCSTRRVCCERDTGDIAHGTLHGLYCAGGEPGRGAPTVFSRRRRALGRTSPRSGSSFTWPPPHRDAGAGGAGLPERLRHRRPELRPCSGGSSPVIRPRRSGRARSSAWSAPRWARSRHVGRCLVTRRRRKSFLLVRAARGDPPRWAAHAPRSSRRRTAVGSGTDCGRFAAASRATRSRCSALTRAVAVLGPQARLTALAPRRRTRIPAAPPSSLTIWPRWPSWNRGSRALRASRRPLRRSTTNIPTRRRAELHAAAAHLLAEQQA
jgi:hypothetical protein